MRPILYTKSYPIRIEFHLVVRSEGPGLCIHTVEVCVTSRTAENFIIFVQGHGRTFNII